MSDADVQRMREAAAAFNRGEIDPILAAFHEGCEVHNVLVMGGGPYRGHEGVQEWMRDIRETFGRFQIEVEDVLEAPRGVLALCYLNAEGTSSGLQLRQPAGHLADFEDGRIRRLRVFLDHSAAREAAGF
jgi:ketosteroid isomerase-like protein